MLQPDVVLSAAVRRAQAVADAGARSRRSPRLIALALVLAVVASVVTVCCCFAAFTSSSSGTAESSSSDAAEGVVPSPTFVAERSPVQIDATTFDDDGDHATEDCGRESEHGPDVVAPRGDVVGTLTTVSGAEQSHDAGAVSLQRDVAAAAKPRAPHLLCVMRT